MKIEMCKHESLKTIWQCYKNPSPEKVWIYSSLYGIANSIGSIGHGILTYNTSIFTFKIFTRNHEIYITPTYVYIDTKKIGTWRFDNNNLNILVNGHTNIKDLL